MRKILSQALYTSIWVMCVFAILTSLVQFDPQMVLKSLVTYFLWVIVTSVWWFVTVIFEATRDSLEDDE